jgi:predicted GTPase
MSPEDRVLFDIQKRKEKLSRQRTISQQRRLQQLGISDNDFNMALIGFSGEGKTSFVNGIRHKSPGMQGFIPSEAMQEGDLKANAYIAELPTGNSLRVWDMPGGGTANHPLDTYFQELCVYEFDLILLFYSTRWTSIHDNIIYQANVHGALERLIIVVNKASMSLDQYAYNKNVKSIEVRDDFYSTTREHIRSKLQVLEKEGVLKCKLERIAIYFICSQRWQEMLHQESELLEYFTSKAAMKNMIRR